MIQLIIKLSPKLTKQYLAAVKVKADAEASQDMEASGVSLDLKFSLLPGLDLLNQISVDGKELDFKSDDVTVDIEGFS